MTIAQSPSPNAINPDAGAFLLRTLGGFELLAAGADGSPGARVLGPGKPLAMLAYCACSPSQRHGRDALAGMFWGDAPVDRQRQNVRQALWRLRRTMGEAVDTTDEAMVALGPALVTDRAQFVSAVQRGDVAAALAAYGGPFLPAATLASGGDEFEEWVAGERYRLEQMLLKLVEPAVVELSASGRHAAARAMLDRLTGVAGDAPTTYRIATTAYLAAGDRIAARRAAEALEQRLADLSGSAVASAVALIARARSDAHEAAVAEAAEQRPALTMDLTGRDAVFATLLRAWKRAQQGETHAVIVTGVAGIGKSRLLSAVAARCATGDACALVIRANPGERDIPFSLAAQMARALAQLPGAVGVDPVSARELVALDPGLATLFKVAASTHDDGEATRRRAFALFDLLSAITEQQPLALFFDDLHWCDAASRQLLASVVARAVDLPLLVVAAARGIATDFLTHPRETRVPLLPLDRDATIAAVRSCGVWPQHPEADRFVQQLADGAGGVPQQVMERLSLAVEKGWLTEHEGAWTSPDWAQACTDVMVTSPLDHRLLGCTVRERSVLLALALAGTSLPLRVMQAATPQLVASQLPDALAVLEAKGLVTSTGDTWQPSHDLILERMIALSTDHEQDAMHAALGEAMLAEGHSANAIVAIRHFLSARLEARAAAVFARIVARARRSHDPRHARDLAADIVGARIGSHDVDILVRAVPWWRRSARTLPRVTMAAIGLLLMLGGVGAWMATRLPVLVVPQGIMLTELAKVYGPDTYRFTVPLIARSSVPRRRVAGDSTAVRIIVPAGNAEILAGGSARFDSSGVASFGALRLRTRDSVVTLRFEAEGYRTTDVRIAIHAGNARLEAARPLRVLDGQLAGQPVQGDHAGITVAPGAPISGVIQMQYNSHWRAASVWLAMTPTWGDPALVGEDILQLATPAQDNVVDVPVDLVAPTAPGHYWILLAIAAEDQGGFILSRTNWTTKTPVWGDGNDLATLPDSVIREANRTGVITTLLAFADGWSFSFAPGHYPCVADTTLRAPGVEYCTNSLGLLGIEVLVK